MPTPIHINFRERLVDLFRVEAMKGTAIASFKEFEDNKFASPYRNLGVKAK